MLDGGSIKEADGCSQWFLSLRSVASGLEKPLLATNNRQFRLTCFQKPFAIRFNLLQDCPSGLAFAVAVLFTPSFVVLSGGFTQFFAVPTVRILKNVVTYLL